MNEHRLIIIGGGPAGLSAALGAKREGLDDVLIVDRNRRPGGLLYQCIHTGFGMRYYGVELTGPEYADRLIAAVEEAGIDILQDTSVVKIGNDKTVMIAGETGVRELSADAVILASGCRERAIGSLPVSGTRPAGVFAAGSVQKMMNLSGYSVGENFVVLGSGDVGMIVARGLVLEGKKVLAVIEQSDKCGGLARNKVRCLDAFGIPLLTRHTISRLYGRERLTGVRIVPVGDSPAGAADNSASYDLECDTLITSVGLIPEVDLLWDLGIQMKAGEIPVNEMRQTGLPWLFVCGNARQVQHFADDVADDGTLTGERAAEYILTRK